MPIYKCPVSPRPLHIQLMLSSTFLFRVLPVDGNGLLTEPTPPFGHRHCCMPERAREVLAYIPATLCPSL